MCESKPRSRIGRVPLGVVVGLFFDFFFFAVDEHSKVSCERAQNSKPGRLVVEEEEDSKPPFTDSIVANDSTQRALTPLVLTRSFLNRAE